MKKSSVHRNPRRRARPAALPSLRGLLWSLPLFAGFGCQWVFGDYEVIDENGPPSHDDPCDTVGTYLCEDNMLYVCLDSGVPWNELLACGELVCDSVDGVCADPPAGDDATAGTESTSTGSGGTAAQ